MPGPATQMFRAILRQLAASSAIYGLGAVLQKVLGIVLVPIYTRYLSPGEYGILTLLLVTGSVAATVLETGMGSALFREVLYERTEPAPAESTALYYVGGQAVLLGGVLMLLAPTIATVVFGNIAYAPLLRLVFLTVAIQLVEILALARCRMRNQPTLYATLSIARFATGAGLTILFVVGLRRGVAGVVTANLLTAAAFSIAYLVLLRQALRPQIARHVLWRLLSYGGPLVPASLASFVLTYADRYYLQHYASAAEVGIYSLGYSIGLAVLLPVQAIQLAWPTQMYAMARRKDGPRLLARTVTYYIGAMAFVGLAVAGLARELLVLLATPRFYDAARIVPFSAAAAILYGLWFTTSTGVDVRNKTVYTIPVIVAAALANLIFNWMLIPRFGMIGAGVATVASYAALLAINVPINLRLWHVPYEYGRVLRIATVCVVVYLATTWVATPSRWGNAAIKLALLSLYPALLYVAGVFDERERRAVRDLVRAWRARLTTALGRL